jgi:CO/xanthine dehydrogenase Mo-binding subunit
MAQTSLPCAAPAIGNAIRDALGHHIKTTPFTPEKVLRVLGTLESSQDGRSL